MARISRPVVNTVHQEEAANEQQPRSDQVSAEVQAAAEASGGDQAAAVVAERGVLDPNREMRAPGVGGGEGGSHAPVRTPGVGGPGPAEPEAGSVVGGHRGHDRGEASKEEDAPAADSGSSLSPPWGLAKC